MAGRIDLPGNGWHSQFFVAFRAQPEPTEIAQLFARDAVLELAGGGD